jgi:hypothetical protein
MKQTFLKSQLYNFKERACLEIKPSQEKKNNNGELKVLA